MLVVFEILKVKALYFWPEKSLITEQRIRIMVWWDWDHLVEQFCFYNFLQNIDCLKDVFKKNLRTFLTPNLRGQPLLLDIKRKVMRFQMFLFNKSSKIPYYFWDILRCNFRGRPHNSLMGSFIKINEKCILLGTVFLATFCSLMHFNILVVFEILWVKDLPFGALKSFIA